MSSFQLRAKITTAYHNQCASIILATKLRKYSVVKNVIIREVADSEVDKLRETKIMPELGIKSTLYKLKTNE